MPADRPTNKITVELCQMTEGPLRCGKSTPKVGSDIGVLTVLKIPVVHDKVCQEDQTALMDHWPLLQIEEP